MFTLHKKSDPDSVALIAKSLHYTGWNRIIYNPKSYDGIAVRWLIEKFTPPIKTDGTSGSESRFIDVATISTIADICPIDQLSTLNVLAIGVEIPTHIMTYLCDKCNGCLIMDYHKSSHQYKTNDNLVFCGYMSGAKLVKYLLSHNNVMHDYVNNKTVTEISHLFFIDYISQLTLGKINGDNTVISSLIINRYIDSVVNMDDFYRRIVQLSHTNRDNIITDIIDSMNFEGTICNRKNDYIISQIMHGASEYIYEYSDRINFNVTVVNSSELQLSVCSHIIDQSYVQSRLSEAGCDEKCCKRQVDSSYDDVKIEGGESSNVDFAIAYKDIDENIIEGVVMAKTRYSNGYDLIMPSDVCHNICGKRLQGEDDKAYGKYMFRFKCHRHNLYQRLLLPTLPISTGETGKVGKSNTVGIMGIAGYIGFMVATLGVPLYLTL